MKDVDTGGGATIVDNEARRAIVPRGGDED